MPSEVKTSFLRQVAELSGSFRKLENTQSLFDIADGRVRIYIRYSKLHGKSKTFYGIRKQDIMLLSGRKSFICFLWDEQVEPLIIPFEEYEEVFNTVPPAPDGQYKTQVLMRGNSTDLYIANAGRFNVESCIGWDAIKESLAAVRVEKVPDLSHSQVQTLVGAVGAAKGYDVWVPYNNRGSLDWSISTPFDCIREFPAGYESIVAIVREIDVIWVKRGANRFEAFFEIEHSTPIYPALLRFNDFSIVSPSTQIRCNIVANDVRRASFARQLQRPTFQRSGLNDICGFLDYGDVYRWHHRLSNRKE